MIETAPKTSEKDPQTPHQDEGRKPAGASLAARTAAFALAMIAIVLGSAVYQFHSTAAKEKARLAQSESETDQARAELSRASARSADLGLQLDRAKSQRSDLQAQLDRARAGQSDLQSQLERARAGLRSQAEEAKAQASDLHAGFQAKLDSANEQSAGLRRELDQAGSRVRDLKAQLARAEGALARLEPLAVKARTLPVAAVFEKNFWDRGLTMHLRNLNPDALTVKVTIGGPDGAAAKSTTIEGGESLSVGNLPAGTNVVVESAGYDPLSVTAR